MILLDTGTLPPLPAPGFAVTKGGLYATPASGLPGEAIIRAALALLGDRITEATEAEPGEPGTDPASPGEDLRDWLRCYFSTCDDETVVAAFLDPAGRVLLIERLAVGGLHAVGVPVRVVVRRVLDLGAAAVVLAHNHPHGNPAPSPHDMQTTRRLSGLLGAIGVRLPAHHIYAAGELRQITAADYAAAPPEPERWELDDG